VNATVETRSFGITADEVVAIDNWVEQIASRWGGSDPVVFRIRVCIAELAANLLEHGGARCDDHVVLTLRRCRDRIGVEFVDPGRPFDPTRAEPTTKTDSVEAMVLGGRGLKLVRAYANEISYRRDGDHNRVMLKFASQ
jgi:anti-sigma regulatory factor (Ser/Thr protein kinase)